MDEQFHCGIYIRKSRDSESKQNFRLEHQREALPKYAAKRGWTFEIYDDGIMSGRDQSNLPQLQRLIEDIKHERINVVLAIEFSRLSRDETMQDFVSFLALCSKYGVALSTLESYRNPANPTEWQMMILEGSFSAVEMRFIMKRMKEGRDRARANGKYLGGLTPFGYRYDIATRKLVIDEAEAIAARRIFKKIQTVPFRGVRDILNRQHVPTRYGKRWTISYLRKMLRYPRLLFYAGYTQVKEGDTVKLVRGEWEAIISLEDAEFIKRSYSKRRSARYGYNVVNRLLSNLRLFYCAKCGRTMVGNLTMSHRPRGVVDVYDYYVCSTNNTDTSCGNASIPTFAIDRLVEQALVEQLGRFEVIERAYKVHQHDVAQRENGVSKADKDLKRLTSEKSRIVSLFQKDLISEAEAEGKLRQLKSHIEELQTKVQAPKNNSMSLEQFRALRSRFDVDKFVQLPFDKKRHFMRQLIRRIEADGRTFSLTFNFPANDGEPVRVVLPKNVSGKLLQLPYQEVGALSRSQIAKRLHEIVEGKQREDNQAEVRRTGEQCGRRDSNSQPTA